MTAPQDEQKIPPRDRRIVKHIKAITEAGDDIELFVQALHAMRDDGSLTSAQRDAIFKTLAQDAAQAYYVIVTGNPIEFDEPEPPENQAKKKK
jgi:hypothetical protein